MNGCHVHGPTSWRAGLVGGLILAAAVAGSANAHHAFSMFDSSREVVLVGTVGRWEMRAPHAVLQVDVPGADGSVKPWAIQFGPAAGLARQGIDKDTFRPSSKVTIVAHPHRRSETTAAFVRAVLASGRRIDAMVED